MDPLFERRQLTRMVHVEAKHLMRNIRANLLAQLSHKFDGVCVAEGYIQHKSIEIVEYSLGRTALIGGGADYRVVFRADICMPHPGQVFRANVSLKSKIGVHADITPIKALLPRDLHIGNPAFEDIKEGEEVEFEVVGSNFQQFDESIVVLGKLKSVVKPDAEVVPEVVSPDTPAPQGAGNTDMKRVVTVDVGATKVAEAGLRRKRIVPKHAQESNEQKQEGSA